MDVESNMLLGKELRWWLRGVDYFGDMETYIESRKLFNEFIRDGDRVIDLGCGNGFLLYLLLSYHAKKFIPYGIDINPERILWAKKLLNNFPSNFYCQNIFEGQWCSRFFDVVIAPLDNNCKFLSLVEIYKKYNNSVRILFYLYDDDYSNFNIMEKIVDKYFSKSLEIKQIQKRKTIKIISIF